MITKNEGAQTLERSAEILRSHADSLPQHWIAIAEEYYVLARRLDEIRTLLLSMGDK